MLSAFFWFNVFITVAKLCLQLGEILYNLINFDSFGVCFPSAA